MDEATVYNRDLMIQNAGRTITRLRDFMRGSGLTGRGADRVIDGLLEAVFECLREDSLLSPSGGKIVRAIARECGAAVPGRDEDYQDEEERQ